MAKVTVYTPSGIIIGNHEDAEFEATDVGTDVPDGNFTSLMTRDGEVNYYGPVIVKVTKRLNEKGVE